jgi:hypothetical protein
MERAFVVGPYAPPAGNGHDPHPIREPPPGSTCRGRRFRPLSSRSACRARLPAAHVCLLRGSACRADLPPRGVRAPTELTVWSRYLYSEVVAQPGRLFPSSREARREKRAAAFRTELLHSRGRCRRGCHPSRSPGPAGPLHDMAAGCECWQPATTSFRILGGDLVQTIRL